MTDDPFTRWRVLWQSAERAEVCRGVVAPLSEHCRALLANLRAEPTNETLLAAADVLEAVGEGASAVSLPLMEGA
jgi:hypothetical protein